MARTRRSDRQLRATVPIIIVTLIMVVFGVRLFDLQVVSASAINTEADGRRGVTASIWASRGPIVDAHGATLANSVDRFDITMAPVNMSNYRYLDPDTNKYVEVTVDEAIAKLATITNQDAGALRAAINEVLAADPESNFAYIARMVTLEQYQQIRAMRIPWVYPQPHPMRTYPGGSVGGNLIGFTGSDGVPLAGLELKYDSCLAGVTGEEMYERSADGVPIPGSVVTVTEPKEGATLRLTIDADTQWRTQQIIAEQVIAMGARYGTITVVEAKTGNIVAAAEYPTVDPNSPASVDAGDRGARTFTAPFEPGSILKPITAASLYDAGAVSPTETILVPDHWQNDDATFGDDTPHEPLTMNMNGVLTESSNVGIAMFGERMSAEQRREYLLKFGLAEPTAVEFVGEEPGIVRPADEWDSQTNYTTMFGQGLTTTAAQMVGAFQAVANDGSRLPLRLVTGCENQDGTVVEAPGGAPVQAVSATAADLTLEGMEATAREGWLANEVAVAGYRVGIKTGTAEIVNPDTGLYEKGSYYTSLVGVAPIDDPQYVVLATMANPVTITGSGSTAAAWQQAMAYVLTANQVAPSPQPWPELTVLH
ncbi:penicillin-binding protein 2 [Gulosibacter macacae]|uniref:Penicillin-binding protein 2 n=1 Tax=Gulosibacter macacae TaxID=2488791 RepID=A0A3P3VW78_9MICO|nr:penicillin-binding protein 2 [Gulosibacter macacae]RRJ86268.1 penicillin-binding protein 2 [Gulosibacter macacae]